MSVKGNINYTGSAEKTDAEVDKTRGSGNLHNPLRVNASTYTRYIHRDEKMSPVSKYVSTALNNQVLSISVFFLARGGYPGVK